VVMLDRRKLAVPLFAQAGAFIVVLVIGGFTGHAAPKQPPGAQGTPGTAVTASPGSTGSPAAAKGPVLKLSVTVTENGTNGLSQAGDTVAGRQVRVLQNGSLASVASGTLSASGTQSTVQEYAANVPAGQYQVCINPPIGWGSAVSSTQVLAGWICSSADLRKGPQVVTFRLIPQIPVAGQ
jgi:hypothetical protein